VFGQIHVAQNGNHLRLRGCVKADFENAFHLAATTSASCSPVAGHPPSRSWSEATGEGGTALPSGQQPHSKLFAEAKNCPRSADSTQQEGTTSRVSRSGLLRPGPLRTRGPTAVSLK
jgi:hypothetical protein